MKPSLPQGTRDFSPAELRRRQYIFNTLRQIFELYGYQPLETPALEQLSTLMGKYGEEGDRLIFKILNNGLHTSKKQEALQEEWTRLLAGPYSSTALTERALRYDLTIPFARYVVMHQNELAFPFKRYQMQPVWRADRPQRGRYREFWQCDCDVVGSTSLLQEAELLCIYQSAFEALKIPGVCIKVNSRKLLAALAEACGAPQQMMELTIALDKLDKVGWSGVSEELTRLGIGDEGLARIESIIHLQGDNESMLAQLETHLGTLEAGKQGIAELRSVLAFHAQLADPSWSPVLRLDLSLARGLNYYTGVIMEVTTDAVKMGSIGGGGRYDDLTGLFGVKNLSGVGVSFGIDRIYDVLDELGLFPESIASDLRVLLLHFGEADTAHALQILKALREAGISSELYPEPAKLDRQMKYANKREVPYVIFSGEAERAAGLLGLKDMRSGTQQQLSLQQVITTLQAA